MKQQKINREKQDAYEEKLKEIVVELKREAKKRGDDFSKYDYIFED